MITNQGLVNWRTCQRKVLNLLNQQQSFYPYQTAKNHIRRRLTGRLPGAGGPLLSVTYTRRPVVRRCSLDSWNSFKIAIDANSINWCARLRETTSVVVVDEREQRPRQPFDGSWCVRANVTTSVVPDQEICGQISLFCDFSITFQI